MSQACRADSYATNHVLAKSAPLAASILRRLCVGAQAGSSLRREPRPKGSHCRNTSYTTTVLQVFKLRYYSASSIAGRHYEDSRPRRMMRVCHGTCRQVVRGGGSEDRRIPAAQCRGTAASGSAESQRLGPLPWDSSRRPGLQRLLSRRSSDSFREHRQVSPRSCPASEHSLPRRV